MCGMEAVVIPGDRWGSTERCMVKLGRLSAVKGCGWSLAEELDASHGVLIEWDSICAKPGDWKLFLINKKGISKFFKALGL